MQTKRKYDLRHQRKTMKPTTPSKICVSKEKTNDPQCVISSLL